ncbi:UNVERIFIED_CONTAM: hypothetical protein GTU68_025603, partial [Idotea baltica]|nr:hypothetical protein [Idotea baltica]
DTSQCVNDLRTRYAGLTGAVSDLLRVLERQSLSSLGKGKRVFNSLNEAITFDALSFSYNEDVQSLFNLSICFEKGKTTALIGKSGAGKSTIVKLLLRLYDCPAGSIFIDGIDIREFDLSSLHSKIAYVNQSNNVFWGTLRENLLYGVKREVSDESISNVVKEVELDSFFESLPNGFDTRIGERGVKVSGGEAQRIAIARAMLKKVDILILDEATSALDANTEQSVQAAFDALSKNKTVILIAHRFSTLRRADKIIAIEDGRVIQQGTREELLKEEGLFASLWDAQQLEL